MGVLAQLLGLDEYSGISTICYRLNPQKKGVYYLQTMDLHRSIDEYTHPVGNNPGMCFLDVGRGVLLASADS